MTDPRQPQAVEVAVSSRTGTITVTTEDGQVMTLDVADWAGVCSMIFYHASTLVLTEHDLRALTDLDNRNGPDHRPDPYR